MSTNLYWSRIPVEPTEYDIGGLKYILAAKLWKSDGSSSKDYEDVGKELLPFLEGVLAGNGSSGDPGKDAKRLIDAIEKYGKVRLCIHS